MAGKSASSSNAAVRAASDGKMKATANEEVKAERGSNNKPRVSMYSKLPLQRRGNVNNADTTNPAMAPRPPPPSHTGAGSYTLTINDKVDIICTTGLCSRVYQGNCEYLELICQHAKILAEKDRSHDSMAINKAANRIVKAVREKGGRFLKRQATDTHWKDIGDVAAVTKTTRQLRLSLKKLEPPVSTNNVHDDEQNPGGDDGRSKAPEGNVPWEDLITETRKKKRELNEEEKAKVALLPSPQREQVLKLTELHPWDVKAAVKIIHVPDFYNRDQDDLPIDIPPRETPVVPSSVVQDPRTVRSSSQSQAPPSSEAVPAGASGAANKRVSCPSRVMETNATHFLRKLFQAPLDQNSGGNIDELESQSSHNTGMALASRLAPRRRSYQPGLLSTQTTKRFKSNFAPLEESPSSTRPPTPLLGSTDGFIEPLEAFTAPIGTWKDTPPVKESRTKYRMLIDQSTPPKPHHPGQQLKHRQSSLSNGPFPGPKLSSESPSSLLLPVGKGYHGIAGTEPQSILYKNEPSNDSLHELMIQAHNNNNRWKVSPQRRPIHQTLLHHPSASASPTPAEAPGCLEDRAVDDLQTLSNFLSNTGWTC